uniref:Uncharacterized protein n=1 Tax=Globisporangium ultimum (strain ATCC 200006 / CBS 805.95 / DAOM BR144) TaxID=431595 RepID=K3X163_GLOUD
MRNDRVDVMVESEIATFSMSVSCAFLKFANKSSSYVTLPKSMVVRNLSSGLPNSTIFERLVWMVWVTYTLPLGLSIAAVCFSAATGSGMIISDELKYTASYGPPV